MLSLSDMLISSEAVDLCKGHRMVDPNPSEDNHHILNIQRCDFIPFIEARAEAAQMTP